MSGAEGRDAVFASIVEELRASEDRAEMLATVVRTVRHDLHPARISIAESSRLLLRHVDRDDDLADLLRAIVAGSGLLHVGLAQLWSSVGPPRDRDPRGDLAEAVVAALRDSGDVGEVRIRVVHAPLIVAVDPAQAVHLVRALVLAARRRTAPGVSAEVELRSVPPPGPRRRELGHARVRVAVPAPGKAPVTAALWRGDATAAFAELGGHDRGMLVRRVEDERFIVDWWVPLA